MVVRANSLFVRFLLVISSPVSFLPALFPVYLESVRVGSNYTDFVRVRFTRPF